MGSKIEKVWAIVRTHNGVDGRGKTGYDIKKIFFDKTEATLAVFPPYCVKEVEVDLVQSLERLRSIVTPEILYLLSCYNGEAITSDLLGLTTLFPKKDDDNV